MKFLGKTNVILSETHGESCLDYMNGNKIKETMLQPQSRWLCKCGYTGVHIDNEVGEFGHA